jgi:hypothetical protein
LSSELDEEEDDDFFDEEVDEPRPVRRAAVAAVDRVRTGQAGATAVILEPRDRQTHRRTKGKRQRRMGLRQAGQPANSAAKQTRGRSWTHDCDKERQNKNFLKNRYEKFFNKIIEIAIDNSYVNVTFMEFIDDIMWKNVSDDSLGSPYNGPEVDQPPLF